MPPDPKPWWKLHWVTWVLCLSLIVLAAFAQVSRVFYTRFYFGNLENMLFGNPWIFLARYADGQLIFHKSILLLIVVSLIVLTFGTAWTTERMMRKVPIRLSLKMLFAFVGFVAVSLAYHGSNLLADEWYGRLFLMSDMWFNAMVSVAMLLTCYAFFDLLGILYSRIAGGRGRSEVE